MARLSVASVIAAAATFVACDEASRPAEGPRRVTEVGVPSPDVRAVPAPSDLNLPPCGMDPTRPGVGSWRSISNLNAPAMAWLGTWTGKEMVIVNSFPGYPKAVEAYNPASDTWRTFAIPSSETFERFGPYVGIAGTSLIVYGGYNTSSSLTYNDGWLIDLESGEWTAINTEGAPALRHVSEAGLPRVFTVGTRLLFVPSSAREDVAAATYDTITGKWERIAPPTDAIYYGCSELGWNGSYVVCSAHEYIFQITAEPLAIRTVPRLFVQNEIWSIAFVPMGDLFFGYGKAITDDGTFLSFFFDPTRGMWGQLTASPSRRFPLVSGPAGRILIWGGSNRDNPSEVASGERRSDGVVFDPGTNAWSPTTCVGAPPSGRLSGVVVATPTGFILFSGNGDQNYLYDVGSR
jgi:hypothetical protein